MTKISASNLRKVASEAINRVAYGGDRIILSRRNKAVAAIVSIEDLNLIQTIEDRLDSESIRKAKTGKGSNVEWAKLKKELGL